MEKTHRLMSIKTISGLSLLVLLLMTACSGRQAKNSGQKEEAQKINCCPPTIYLQPCNNFTKNEAEKLIPKFKAFIKESSGVELSFEVKPPIQLHDTLMNDSHTRYRADKIIRSIEDNHHDAVIVLLHQDISCTYKSKKDWGILGLSLVPKYKICVASDYRLKDKKRDLWKVAAHEFLHSYCNMRHCAHDNPSCLMKDAKGHADFSNKNHLCKSCKSKCNI